MQEGFFIGGSIGNAQVGANVDAGKDAAYGIGARFKLSPLEIRGEYEIFDISDVEDLTMRSPGVVWRF